MKFTRVKEIEQIIAECKSFEELNRLARLQAIYIDEITKKLDSIWILDAKIKKLSERENNGITRENSKKR